MDCIVLDYELQNLFYGETVSKVMGKVRREVDIITRPLVVWNVRGTLWEELNKEVQK